MPETQPKHRGAFRVAYALFVMSVVVPGLAQSNASQSAATAADDAAVLMYTLPGSVIHPGPADTEVVLSVEIDGAAVATQTLRVPAEDPPRDRLIEVLAGQPAARADVERRLRGGARNATVVVRVNGKEYRRLPWSELLSANAPATPTEAASPSITESLTSGQQQCSARCDEEYDQCLRTCEPFSGPNACWNCRDLVQACGNFCTSCPRTWRTYGSWTEVLPRQTTGQLLCAYEQSAGGVRLHREFQRTYRRTVTEFTEHCDRNVTRVTTFETRLGDTCWTQIGGCRSATDVFGSRKKCP